MGTYIDEITGLRMTDAPIDNDLIYMIQNKEDYVPAGHRSMGFGIAHALAKSLADAKRMQLEMGVRATTEIMNTNTGEVY